MRKLIIAAAGLAAAMLPVSAASAQGYYGRGGYSYGQGNGYGQGYGYGRGNRAVQRELRECRRELRHARNRWEYQRELRECEREIARARYNSQRRGYGRGW